MHDMKKLPWPATPMPDQVVKALEQVLARSSALEYQEAMATVVPDGKPIYGVRVPELRALAKELLTTYGKAIDVIKPIAEMAWIRDQREQQLVSLFLLDGIRLSAAERWGLGVRFLPNVTNWETCDQLCMALLGRALAEEPSYMDFIESWVADENLWVRRAALVAPVYLRRAKYDEPLASELDRRTLKICEAMLGDGGEKYIRKAVDWSIRAVITRHYAIARDWLFRMLETSLPQHAYTTLKSAAKKLEPDDLAAFLKTIEYRSQ